MEFKPYDYQRYTIERILDTKKIMVVLDMGMGKTACTLTAINELLFERFENNKVLVVAPLRVASKVWADEINKFNHLKNIKVSKILGTAAERVAGLNAKADLYLINRENVAWLVDVCIKRKQWPFDILVIDESSSFKNHTANRFKALRKVSHLCDRVINLTGTPSPNSLIELWPQVYLLDKGERLSTSFYAYRARYFDYNEWSYKLTLKKGADKAIHEAISDIAISLRSEDYLKLPPVINNVIRLQLDKKAKAQYDEMERDAILEFENSETVIAGSAGVLTGKLLQMANGAVYGLDKKVLHLHDTKLDALSDIIDDNDGKPIMVFYYYKHDYDRLRERFKDLTPRELNTDKDIDDWNNGKIRLLLAHPGSVGHGLNLQYGGNIAVWFGLTWSLELYLQANKRLHRPGQRESVILHHLIAEGTVDEEVMRALTDKRVNQNELIEALKMRVLG